VRAPGEVGGTRTNFRRVTCSESIQVTCLGAEHPYLYYLLLFYSPLNNNNGRLWNPKLSEVTISILWGPSSAKGNTPSGGGSSSPRRRGARPGSVQGIGGSGRQMLFRLSNGVFGKTQPNRAATSAPPPDDVAERPATLELIQFTAYDRSNCFGWFVSSSIFDHASIGWPPCLR